MERESVIFDENKFWIYTHTEDIITILSEERSFATRMQLRESNEANFYDPNKRCLSEMAICEGLSSLDLPDGLYLQKGIIRIIDKGERFHGDHTYLVGNGKVYCLTPGQFVDMDDDKGYRPGDRINYLKSLAPNLVETFPGGIAVLSGTQWEIFEALSFMYPKC